MMSSIIYRVATKNEAAAIAHLVDIASGGMVDFLFKGIIPDTSPREILQSEIEKEDSLLSYQNSYVAVDDGKVIGLANGYSAIQHGLSAEMEEFLPSERLEIFRDFFKARVENSWYLNILSVAPDYRGLGIGTNLINLAKQKAKANHFSTISLMVLVDNIKAHKLYEQEEFKEVQKVNFKPHPLWHHPDGCFLMKCDL